MIPRICAAVAELARIASSHDTGHRDTLDGANIRSKKHPQPLNPTLLVKKALKGVKKVAQSTSTVIGTVASEMLASVSCSPIHPQPWSATHWTRATRRSSSPVAFTTRSFPRAARRFCSRMFRGAFRIATLPRVYASVASILGKLSY